jgi:hypothetical protein
MRLIGWVHILPSNEAVIPNGIHISENRMVHISIEPNLIAFILPHLHIRMVHISIEPNLIAFILPHLHIN